MEALKISEAKIKEAQTLLVGGQHSVYLQFNQAQANTQATLKLKLKYPLAIANPALSHTSKKAVVAVAELRNLNFLQKDCLRPRKLSR